MASIAVRVVSQKRKSDRAGTNLKVNARPTCLSGESPSSEAPLIQVFLIPRLLSAEATLAVVTFNKVRRSSLVRFLPTMTD